MSMVTALELRDLNIMAADKLDNTIAQQLRVPAHKVQSAEAICLCWLREQQNFYLAFVVCHFSFDVNFRAAEWMVHSF